MKVYLTLLLLLAISMLAIEGYDPNLPGIIQKPKNMSQDLKTMIKTRDYLHNPSLCKVRKSSNTSGLLSRSQSLQLPGALAHCPGTSAPLTPSADAPGPRSGAKVETGTSARLETTHVLATIGRQHPMLIFVLIYTLFVGYLS